MTRSLWPILLGFTVWSLAFVGLYALQYLGCYIGLETAAHRVLLVVGYALALLALGGLLMFQVIALRSRRATPDAVGRIGVGASAAALFSGVVTFAPTLIASACQ